MRQASLASEKLMDVLKIKAANLGDPFTKDRFKLMSN
jgi:hypothetical protein